MATSADDPQEDRIELRLEAGGPVSLRDLTDSLNGLSDLFQRASGFVAAEGHAQLYITSIRDGSILAVLAPYVQVLGQAYAAISYADTLASFSSRLNKGLRAFAGMDAADEITQAHASEDAADLAELIKPLVGRRGAELGFSHVRIRKRNGEREVEAEYHFRDADLDRANANIERSLVAPPLLVEETSSQRTDREVALFFDQASRAPSRASGRTGDRAIVPSLSDKPLPTYFRKSSVGDLKDMAIRGDANPLRGGFIVDVATQLVGGQPRAYLVTNVHAALPPPEED